MQTLGEKRCGVYSSVESVVIKSARKKIAELIDGLEKERGDKNTTPASAEKQRLISIAQTKLEEACMFTVKTLYEK
ncbi:hypothetical protein ACFFUE_07185 [Bergeyella porcorum]|uniref:Acb2/Tad1 domain-containing protein n=1 Tax=Bergeyella porcorum TaxID=1735111 RepID=UPI0035EA7CC5